MSGYPAHDPGVLVIDLSLDNAPAESAVFFGWRSPCSARIARWIERGEQLQWLEDFALAELVQRLTGDSLDRLPQQNKADIAVFSTGAGISAKRNRQGLLD